MKQFDLRMLFLIASMVGCTIGASAQAVGPPFELNDCLELFAVFDPDDQFEPPIETEQLIERVEREVERSPGALADTGPKLQSSVSLVAGEQNGRGVLTYAGAIQTDEGGFSNWALSVDVPFDKTKGQGSFLSLTGLGGDVVFKAERDWFRWQLRPVAYGEALCQACNEAEISKLSQCSLDGLEKWLARSKGPVPDLDQSVIDRIDEEVDKIGEELGAALHESCRQAGHVDCSVEGWKSFRKAQLLVEAKRQAAAAGPSDGKATVEAKRQITGIRDTLFGKSRLWGVEGAVARKDRGYFELDGTEKDEHRAGFSASIFAGVSLTNGMVYGRLIGKRDYKEGDKATRCSEIADSILETCKEQPIGEATETESLVAAVEWRRFFNRLAISPTVAYDFEIEEWAAELPIFVLQNKEGAFTGGVKLIWGSQTDDLSAAVFVSKALDLEP